MQRCSEKAFAMCPYRKFCGTIENATFTDNSECAACNRSVEDKPMTNADRIRAMSDEELAGFLMSCDAGNFLDAICNEDDCPEYDGETFGCSVNCLTAVINWLHKPAKDNAATLKGGDEDA